MRKKKEWEEKYVKGDFWLYGASVWDGTCQHPTVTLVQHEPMRLKALVTD
jgi:hypothetical protein